MINQPYRVEIYLLILSCPILYAKLIHLLFLNFNELPCNCGDVVVDLDVHLELP